MRDALVAAGIGRVVIALRDPNPLVSGRGAARLADAGIAVEWSGGGAESRELNIGFVSRMERGRPWLRMKAAVSLDGRSALDDGTSQWITGAAARADGHAWRRRAGALLTGAGTVREDDPRLDVRLVATAHQPLRVIVDSRLETPATARIVAPPGAVLVYAAVDDAARRRALEQRGVEVALLPAANGKVDLAAMVADLGRREVNELHVEAGEKLNASLLAAGLVDELLVYVAPRLVGPGRGLAALAPIARLDGALGFSFTAIDRVGDDLRLRLRPAAHERADARFGPAGAVDLAPTRPAPATNPPNRARRLPRRPTPRSAKPTIGACSPASSAPSAESSTSRRSAPTQRSAMR